MISLEINASNVATQLSNYLNNIKQITKPVVVDEISKAVFTITAERFVLSADKYARSNPKKMHHVYEWGEIGNPESRLFVLKRSYILEGKILIGTNFLPSKLPVPINPELLIPGSTGKVVTRKSIFKDKASVMESGQSVSFTAQRILSFVGDSGLVFIKPGTTINILNPGGVGTKNAFAEYLLSWYTDFAGESIDSSGLYEKLSNDITIALNGNSVNINTVKNAVVSSIEAMGLNQEVVV